MMNRRMNGLANARKNRLALIPAMGLALCFTGAVTAPAIAQGAQEDGEQAADLPSPESIIDRAIEVGGGADRVRQIKGRRTTGTVSIPSQGIEGKIEVVQLAPDNMIRTIEIPGLMTDVTCVSGGVVWATNTMQGPRIVEGAEAEGELRNARVDNELNYKDNFSNFKTEGIEDVNGEAAYKVTMTDNASGKVNTRYYSVESGFLLRMEIVQVSAMGEVPSVSTFSDFRDAGGLKAPFRTEIQVMGMTQILQLESIEDDDTIGTSAFEAPEEVQALIDG